MTEAKEKIKEFKQTMGIKGIVNKVRYSVYEAMVAFDDYPTLEVRQGIIRHWLDDSIRIFDQHADWIEQRILDLKEEEVKTRQSLHFWEDLLNWYIFNTSSVSRAMNFAIGLTQNNFGGSPGFLYRSNILKLVVGKLERTSHIYQSIEMPSVKLFLESFLVKAYQPNSTISDYAMVDIKRVVRCAISVGDWHFLPQIELVLYKLSNQRRSKRYDFKQEAEILENIAFLREAVRFFREKTEEVKDA